MTRAELLKLLPAWKSNDDANSSAVYDILNFISHGYISSIIRGKSLKFYSRKNRSPIDVPEKLVIHRINDAQYVISEYLVHGRSRYYLAMRIGITILNDQRKAFPSYMESRHEGHPTLITREDGNLLVAFIDWLCLQNCYQYGLSLWTGTACKEFDPVMTFVFRGTRPL